MDLWPKLIGLVQGSAADGCSCYIHQMYRVNSHHGCAMTTRGRLRHVQRVRSNASQQKRGRHRPENVEQQCNIFWPVATCGRPLCGTFRQSKVHLVQHDILWPTYSVPEFRKPYLKFSNSSKTSYSCDAEFTVSKCHKMYAKAPTLYRTGPNQVLIRPRWKQHHAHCRVYYYLYHQSFFTSTS